MEGDEIIDLNNPSEEPEGSREGEGEGKPAEGEPAAKAEDKAAAELKEIRRELEEAKRIAADSKKLAEFWAEKAKAPEKPAAAAKGPLSPDEFLNEFTAKGVDAIKEQGFVHQRDLDAIIEKRLAEREAANNKAAGAVQKALNDTGLAGDPELMNEARRHLQQIAEQYPDMNEVAAINWAAERAKSSMGTKQQPAAGSDRLERARQVSGGDRGSARGVMAPGARTVFNSNDNQVFANLERHGLREKSFRASKERGRDDL
jgi:hypothetical protein